jgi:hypothetical protein
MTGECLTPPFAVASLKFQSFCTVEEKLPPTFLHNHGSQTRLSQKTASDFAPGVKHFQHIQGHMIWCTVLICCHLNSIELGPVVLLNCSLKSIAFFDQRYQSIFFHFPFDSCAAMTISA